ncbi:hypothetical protein H7849_02675 [Alloacidobacterium dinghuense]|uniref:DUF3108 domain-containing protein n=1 Tax=Alloacidobacterium dinghuense TaxID=2763107 RepID=A0A7G8BK45_9BACT|nr:hypothetical protein [Alloacidobacterium dinghuense]QNI32915.1 hypothetical protein H7849_02675 [Alloacidobacterium dinghuense]
MPKGGLRIAFFCMLVVSTVSVCYAQATATMPPDYRGVSVRIPGVFVTPVPDAPFSATVEIVSKQKLEAGSFNIRTTTNHVARDAAGRIYNERRQLVSTSFKGDPILLSAHIYDPATRTSTYLDPFSHLARQSVLRQPQTTAARIPVLGPHAGAALTTEQDLGEQTIGTTLLRGTKKVWTVPATASGTGKAVEIVDQYWYSPELSVYLIVQHDDPRTGEQIVAVKDVSRGVTDESLFAVPSRYRVVDETPEP